MYLFFTIFFSIYTALNYYVFIKGWQALNSIPVIKPFYIAAFMLTSYGYIFAKLFDKYLTPAVYNLWLTIGAYWFAFFVYFIFFLLGLDIILLLDSLIHFLPDIIYNNYELTGQIISIVIVGFVSLIVLLGNYYKRNIIIKTLNISLPKKNGKLNELNIVMAADLHLSTIDGEKLLSSIVDKINSLNPDIILFAGDIVDDKAVILKDRGIGNSFKKLNAKYGMYTVNGNHEFINDVEQSDKFLEKFGIKVLRDNYELIDNSFYIIGREDVVMKAFTGRSRMSLMHIISTITSDHLKILLDHTPVKLHQAEESGIDLQLSGHTHNGQIWPGNIFTRWIFEVSHGYKKKGTTHYYVTSGAGTWGPPVRIRTRSEIVNIKITFN